MLDKVKSFINSQNLLSTSCKVVVGVSGGADSIVLLHMLGQLGFQCVAAHCNFHLRMEESNRDEAFVRKLCLDRNIELYSVDFKTNEYAIEHKISIEMAARKLRYDWFEEIRLETHAEAIAVAHHADDNAETMLLNLVRGTGIRGLTGINPKNGFVVRPLLCMTRLEVEKYASLHNLTFVTDSTNAENDYQRNKIRNIIFPLLSEINPSVIQTMNENAERLEGSFKIYEQSIKEKRKLIVHNNVEELYIDIELLKNEVGCETLLYEFCREYGFHPHQTKAIFQSINGISGKIWYSDTHKLLKDRKYLIISLLNTKLHCEVQVNENDEQTFEPINLAFKHLKYSKGFEVSRQAHCAHIDAALLQYPLTIRQPQTGDSFIPFGMKGRKKISDFFTDIKLSAFEKERTYLLLSGNEIVWVIGYRTDNRFCVTDKSTDILEIVVR